MKNKLDYLFQYIEKENIDFDKNEFLFQIQSHPDYPSLLSISDTLKFLSIDNIIFNYESKNLETLPDRFIVFLKVEKNVPKPFFIENKNGKYFIYDNKKQTEITVSELESRWNHIVFLVEKPEFHSESENKNNLLFLFGAVSFVLFLITLIQFKVSLSTALFFLFPLLGTLFSIASLKDLFGVKIQMINSLCNFSSSTNCDEVIKSDKWKIFKLINFSDLSIVFFTTQFISLFFMILSGVVHDYFYIESILVFFSVPIILLSVYYQKIIAKKWCPICLIISSIIIAEIAYMIYFELNHFGLSSIKSTTLFSAVFLLILVIWFTVKKILLSQKELKEFQFKSNRFQRNYTNFKTILLSGEKVILPNTPIILGNRESKVKISIITNPFCGYCKSVHESIEKIINAFEDKIQVNIILKVEMELEDDNTKLFFRNLIDGYLKKGDEFYLNAINDWYRIKKIDDWNKLHNIETNKFQTDKILADHLEWCVTNNFNYTPAIFINDYEYPDTYDRNNLEHFILELSEDSF